LRRIFLAVFVASVVTVLTSCGAPSTGSERASSGKDNTGETTSPERSQPVEETTTEETSATTAEATVAQTGPEPSSSTAASPAVGGSSMVSSASPYATRAGLQILDSGGNAFDAAVAIAAALNVAEPMMSGIGGYGAIVIYDAESGETRFLDTGNRVPKNLDPSLLHESTPNYIDNRCGALAVATPGNLKAWETLSNDYGELEWGRLFDPAIVLADEGIVLDDITAGWIDAAWPAFPENAKSFYGNNGVPLRAGDTLVQEDLASSFRLIADEGASAMYEGELGRAIDATIREYGGFLTLDDLGDNRARWRETISLDYRGYEVVTASPSSTSWGALVRLGVMGQFGMQPSDHNTTSYLHTFAEVSKQTGKTTRDYAADPEIAETPLDLLFSQEFLAKQAAAVNPSQASPNEPFAQFGQPTRCIPQSYTTYASPSPDVQNVQNAQQEDSQQGHTTHFVVADEAGNVVSATQTLGNIFGSKVMPEGTGIWLNDALSWSRFDPPGNVFDVYPGRQSLYALCPTIVMSDGRPYIAIGTPGGRTIQQTTPQMLMNVIDFGMDIQQAISAPRVSTTFPDALVVEAGIPVSVRNELSALGHNVVVDERGLGNAHALTIEYDSQGNPSIFTGGADPRGEGVAAGT